MADFAADFAADFPTELSVDFLADFAVNFLADFSVDFCWILGGVFGWKFSVDFAWKCQQNSLENVPKACRTNDLTDFLKKSPKNSRTNSTCSWVGCLTLQSHPLQTLQILVAGWEACHHANAKRYAGLLVLLCLLKLYFPINLQGTAEKLQAAVRSKAAPIGIWSLPALPITKKGRANGKIPKIHHIFALQIFRDKKLGYFRDVCANQNRKGEGIDTISGEREAH